MFVYEEEGRKLILPGVLCFPEIQQEQLFEKMWLTSLDCLGCHFGSPFLVGRFCRIAECGRKLTSKLERKRVGCDPEIISMEITQSTLFWTGHGYLNLAVD